MALAQAHRRPFGGQTLRPGPCCRRAPAVARRRAAAATAAAPAAAAAAELDAAAEALARLSQSGAPQQEIDEAAERLEQSSAAAGANSVFPELNDGSFRGYTLSGQTAQRFSTVITLGVLSFNCYQPKDLKIKTGGTASGGVHKGPRDGAAQAYVIATPFEVVGGQEEGGAEAAAGTGIKGRSLAIGEYERAPDNKQRLVIRFKKMQLEPAAESPAELQRWLDTFAPHNPNMDPATGVLTVDLPAKSPEGWMDYLLMTEGWQLVRGNFGSKTLLQRV